MDHARGCQDCVVRQRPVGLLRLHRVALLHVRLALRELCAQLLELFDVLGDRDRRRVVSALRVAEDAGLGEGRLDAEGAGRREDRLEASDGGAGVWREHERAELCAVALAVGRLVGVVVLVHGGADFMDHLSVLYGLVDRLDLFADVAHERLGVARDNRALEPSQVFAPVVLFLLHLEQEVFDQQETLRDDFFEDLR